MGDARVSPTSRNRLPRLPQSQARLFLRTKSEALCAGPTQVQGTHLGTKHTSLLWGQ